MHSLYEGWSKRSRPDLFLFRRKLKYNLLLIVAKLRIQHAQYDFWAINILYIIVYEQSVCQMALRTLTPEKAHKFLKNFSNDTDVTQQKFISQLVIQNETCTHHFDSESEQQSMRWNERIGQNCHFITLRRLTPFSPCHMQTTDDR